MIDISKGRYWSEPWSLVSGCTPCSPGCDHCWSAAMTHRFRNKNLIHGCGQSADGQHWTINEFNGQVLTHPERLSIPLKRRKPTVWAVWNDLFHEAVPDEYRHKAYAMMGLCRQHGFLILTKHPENMARYWSTQRVVIGTHWYEARRRRKDGTTISAVNCGTWPITGIPNIYHGLTVCNQAEADAKIPVFLQVPGKKFLSIEPMLGPINVLVVPGPRQPMHDIDAVILGGETGPGARPMHPDWLRSVRDQCAAAGVPFFFKGWGEWAPMERENGGPSMASLLNDGRYLVTWEDGKTAKSEDCPAEGPLLFRVGKKKAGRLLDGRTHDDLPWVSP